MRLRTIQRLLRSYLDDVVFHEARNIAMGSGEPGHELLKPSAPAFRAALAALGQIPGFHDARRLANDEAVRQPGETLRAAASVWKGISQRAAAVHGRGVILLEVVNELLTEDSEGSFSVTLPPVSGLGELRDVIEQVREVLDLPLEAALHERVQVEAADRGSIVLELTACSAGAVLFVAALATFLDNYARTRLQREQAVEELARVSSDVQAMLAPVKERALQELRSTAISDASVLMRDHARPDMDDGERHEASLRAANAAEAWFGLYERGARLRMAIEEQKLGAIVGGDGDRAKLVEKALGLLGKGGG